MNNFKWCNNKNALFFVGGIIFSAIGTSFTKSKSCKKMCVTTMAKGLKVKGDIEHKIAIIKEEAEDMYNEAKSSESNCGGDCTCGTAKE